MRSLRTVIASCLRALPEGGPTGYCNWLHGWKRDHGPLGLEGKPHARFRNLCLSREAGAGGNVLARMIGTRLGWKVYDHELLDAIAQRMEVSLEEARTYDELAPSVIQDWLLPLGEEHYAPHEAYLDHLAKLVEAIGRSGHSIIVGRGASFLLPREETLSIRVIAPLRIRAARLSERMGISLRTAKRVAREQDRRSRRFARVMHHADPTDPHHYDLVLDTHSLSLNLAAEIIAHAIEAGRASTNPAHETRPLIELELGPNESLPSSN